MALIWLLAMLAGALPVLATIRGLLQRTGEGGLAIALIVLSDPAQTRLHIRKPSELLQ